MRKKLPNRRLNETFELVAGTPDTGIHFYSVTVARRGRFGQGDISEVFLSTGKAGTAMDIMGLELSRVMSIALQYGATLEELGSSMPRTEDGTPEGVLGALCDQLLAERQPNVTGLPVEVHVPAE